MSRLPKNSFAIVSRDEVWSAGSGCDLIESRLVHGACTRDAGQIIASDVCDDELLVMCDEAGELARRHLRDLYQARVRIRVSARRSGEKTRTTVSLNIALSDLSLVSDPDHVAADYVTLSGLTTPALAAPGDRSTMGGYRGIPIVWLAGSASVLMHESAGHAAEHGARPIAWPEWLSVRDEPEMEFDDTGAVTSAADLLSGEAPHSLLCESFSDVPLARMSRVVVRQRGAAFDTPQKRIEIAMLAGGLYEPLTDGVTLLVSSADLVEGERRTPLQPFQIHEQRGDVAAALRGARGPTTRYPGVVCSREGQEMVVGSFAPEILTIF